MTIKFFLFLQEINASGDDMNHEFATQWIGHEGCAQFAKVFALAVFEASQDHDNHALVVRLDGTLGAGKTYFTQQLALELGASDGEVTSPTFVIIQSYETHPRMSHLDLYRVKEDDEFFELGIEEMFEQSGLMLIEWGGKFSHLLPEDHLCLEIDVLSEDNRAVRLISYGPRSDAILEHVRG